MALAASALPARAFIPVQEYVYLNVTGRNATVTGIGNEMSVRASIDLDGQEYGGGGAVLLPAQLVLSAIDGLNETLTITNNSISWKGGRLNFEKSDGDYPEFSWGKEWEVAKLPARDFANALTQMATLADNTVEMSSAGIIWYKGQTFFAGGHHSVGMLKVEAGSDAGNEIGIPKALAGKIAKMLDTDANLEINRNQSTVFFRTPTIDLSVVQPEAKMLSYMVVFDKSLNDPSYFDIKVGCDQILRLVEPVAKSFGNTYVTLACVNGLLSASFVDPQTGRGMVQSLPVETTVDWSIVFPVHRLITQLRLGETIKYKEPTQPLLIQSKEYTGLAVPVLL